MAKREDEKQKRAEDPEEDGDLGTSDERESDADEGEGEDESRASAGDDGEDETSSASDDDEDADDDDDGDDGDDAKAKDDADEGESKAAAGDEPDADEASTKSDEDPEDEAPPAQLGTQRYVMSAFFGAALLFAYILGRAIEGTWQNLANRDWLVERAPIVASVTDDAKSTYSTIIAGVIALVVAFRSSRKPDVRQWSEEVSGELLKVKWPSRKDVYASTVVVLATSAIAVTYLFLLDRFWGFVTNLIYGSGT